MTIYLRDDENRTLVDCELSAVKAMPDDVNQDGYVELHSVVCIGTYTDLLIKNLQYSQILMEIFIHLQELRGWLWEFYLPNQNRASRYDEVVQEVRKMFSGIAAHINLLCGTNVSVVED